MFPVFEVLNSNSKMAVPSSNKNGTNNNLYFGACLLIFILALIAVGPRSCLAQDDQAFPETLKAALELRTKLSADFQNKAEATTAEKIAMVNAIVQLERNIISRLEANDSAYSSAIESPPETILQGLRQGTLANTFFLARLQKSTSDFPAAINSLTSALETSRLLYGDEGYQTREYALQLAQVQWLKDATDEQLQQWTQADQARTQGVVDFRNQNFANAKTNFIKAKTVYESLNLTDMMDYGESIANLAEAVAAMGDLDEAESVFQEAIQVNEKILTRYSPTNATMRRSFAQVYRQNGKMDLAQQTHEDAAEIIEKIFGPESVPMAENLYARAVILQLTGKLQEANDMYRTTYAILIKREQGNGQLALNIMSNLHKLYNSVAQHSDAAEAALAASEIAEANFGDPSNELADWLMLAGVSLRNAADYARAIEVLNRTKAMFESLPDFQKREGYLSGLSHLALALHANDEPDKALEIARHATELSEQATGENSMGFAFRAQNLAYLLTMTGHHDEAEALFPRVLAFLKQELGEQHIEYQRIINDRARNLATAKKWEPAIEQWVLLLDLQNKHLPPENPERIQTLKHLVEAYTQVGNLEAANDARNKIPKEETNNQESDKE